MSQPQELEGQRNITVNRRARHDYLILETLEGGLVLAGSEVRALREGQAHLSDAYAQVKGQEVFLINAHIGSPEHAVVEPHDPRRTRKVLLNRQEIRRLVGKVQEKGLTLIPLRLYFRKGLCKVELALARGKKLHDKREAEAAREARREMERAVRERSKA